MVQFSDLLDSMTSKIPFFFDRFFPMLHHSFCLSMLFFSYLIFSSEMFVYGMFEHGARPYFAAAVHGFSKVFSVSHPYKTP